MSKFGLSGAIYLFIYLCVIFNHVNCESKLCNKLNKKFNPKNGEVERTSIIKVHSGKLVGKIMTNVWNGAKYSSFKGIPYADPPISDKRFLPPKDVEPWTDVLEAFDHGNVCSQMDFDDDEKYLGNENCLFLNVYTPVTDFGFNNNNTVSNPKKAVMVWIHGGGFFFGSGDSDYFGPDFLLDKDVILVTFNYRLGALGFLNLRHPMAPGNAGLKDQSLVLKWINKNIEKFGGDPDNVTIFGQSAGGASVDLHLVSEMSQGLFRRSIALSGSVFCRWAFTDNPLKHAKILAKMLEKNFRGYSPDMMAHQFLSADIEDIARISAKFVDTTFMELPFVPSIEWPNVTQKDAFIDRCYDTKFRDGNFFQGEHMLGFTNAETNLLYRYIDAGLQSLLRVDSPDSEGDVVIMQQVPNDPVSLLRSEGILKKYAYELFEKPIDIKQQYMIEYGNPNLFYYVFGYEEDDRLIAPGAIHGDDLAYIFYMRNSDQYCDKYLSSANKIGDDERMRDRYTSILTNFAKYGDPSIKLNHGRRFVWAKSGKRGEHVKITDEGQLKFSSRKPIKNQRLRKQSNENLCSIPKPDSYDLLTDAFIELL